MKKQLSNRLPTARDPNVVNNGDNSIIIIESPTTTTQTNGSNKTDSRITSIPKSVMLILALAILLLAASVFIIATKTCSGYVKHILSTITEWLRLFFS